MPGIRENSPAENAIFTLQISFEIEQWNLRNRLRTLHVTDGLFRALGVPRRFAACVGKKIHTLPRYDLIFPHKCYKFYTGFCVVV